MIPHFFRQPLVRKLGSLRLTVGCLCLLFILTIWGTLYQKQYGLFQAQQVFYNSWFFLGGGWLPLPGAQTVLAVLFLNLVAAMGWLASLKALRPGILLIHGGLIILLVAGATTFYFGEESSLALLEGQRSNLSASYHDWEIAVLKHKGPGQRDVSAVDAAGLKSGDVIGMPDAGITLRVETYLEHSQPTQGGSPTDLPINARGWTGLGMLKTESEPGQNRPGLMAAIQKGSQTLRVLLHATDPADTSLTFDDGEMLGIRLRRKRYGIPGTLELLSFQKEMYPNSNIAKSYESRVRLVHEGVERETTISMNKPLRFRGYTLYQSSYKDLPDGSHASIFAVVKNHGRTIPYVATGVTFAGMVVYFGGMLLLRVKHAPEGRTA